MQHNVTTMFVLVTILTLCFQTNFISANISNPPTSLNTTLNAKALFNCTVDNAITVYWLINNNSSGLYDDAYANLQMNSGNGGNTLVSTLSLPAVSSYNQSVIVCNAVLLGLNNVVKSDPVVLLIQGPLEPVINLTTTLIDNSTVSIKWTPPHSIANIPINYTVTVAGQLFGYSLSMVTTDSSYYIELPDHCDNYWVSIMANNAAGNGKNTTVVVYQMEATYILPDTVEVSVAVPSQGSKPQATINFNVTHNCSVPLTHSIAVQTDTNSDTLSLYGPYYTNSTNEMVTVVINELIEDTFYYLSIWDQITPGTVSNPVEVNLSSYDVQNVSISVDDNGVICISCYFIPGTQSGGCIMELTAEGDDNDFISVHLSRRSDEDMAFGCIQNLMWGVYSVNVFDAETGGYKLPGASPALTRVGVSVMPRPLVTSSSLVSVTRAQSHTVVSSSAMRSTSATISPSSGTDRSKSQQAVNITYRNAAIGVGVVVIVIIVVLFVLIIIQVRKLRQKRKRLSRDIVGESSSNSTVHFRAQVSSENVTTGLSSATPSSTTPSPPIETMSRDEEAPPPPPPPTSAPVQQQLRVSVPPPLTVTSTGATGTNDDQRRHSDGGPSSPGAESSTSFTTLLQVPTSSSNPPPTVRTRSNSNPNSTRPSSYHEPSMNVPPGTTDYRRYITSHQGERGAPNRTRTSSLRSNTVMTAWAAVNPLTLPVLPEAPPPYDEIERDSMSYQRPQSALIMSTGGCHEPTNSSSVSEPQGVTGSSPPTTGATPTHMGTTPMEYVSLHFSPSSDSITSLTSTNRNRNSTGTFTSGNVQYAIISSSNTFVSSNNRLGTFHVTNSLV